MSKVSFEREADGKVSVPRDQEGCVHVLEYCQRRTCE